MTKEIFLCTQINCKRLFKKFSNLARHQKTHKKRTQKHLDVICPISDCKWSGKQGSMCKHIKNQHKSQQDKKLIQTKLANLDYLKVLNIYRNNLTKLPCINQSSETLRQLRIIEQIKRSKRYNKLDHLIFVERNLSEAQIKQFKMFVKNNNCQINIEFVFIVLVAGSSQIQNLSTIYLFYLFLAQQFRILMDYTQEKGSYKKKQQNFIDKNLNKYMADYSQKTIEQIKSWLKDIFKSSNKKDGIESTAHIKGFTCQDKQKDEQIIDLAPLRLLYDNILQQSPQTKQIIREKFQDLSAIAAMKLQKSATRHILKSKYRNSKKFKSFFADCKHKLHQKHPKWTKDQLGTIIQLLWKKQTSKQIRKTSRLLVPTLEANKKMGGKAFYGMIKRQEGLTTPQISYMWRTFPVQTKKYWKEKGMNMSGYNNPKKSTANTIRFNTFSPRITGAKNEVIQNSFNFLKNLM